MKWERRNRAISREYSLYKLVFRNKKYYNVGFRMYSSNLFLAFKTNYGYIKNTIVNLQAMQRQEEMVVMKKVFGKEMIVLWVSLAALVCAAISLNDSLNQLAEKEQGNDMD